MWPRRKERIAAADNDRRSAAEVQEAHAKAQRQQYVCADRLNGLARALLDSTTEEDAIAAWVEYDSARTALARAREACEVERQRLHVLQQLAVIARPATSIDPATLIGLSGPDGVAAHQSIADVLIPAPSRFGNGGRL